VITGRTSLGARNRVFQFASIGEIPQDRKYGGEPTTTTIGDDNVFREFVTIHAGTAQDRGDTSIGNGNLFLAYTHVAHDCVVGNGTVFSNNAQIAGHVRIDDWVVLGAYGGVHQFCRVGAHAMIAAGAIVLQDVPPFVTASGYPAKPHGTNSEGLRRRGFPAADILAIRRAYKTLYREGRSLDDARVVIAGVAEGSPALAPLVEFLAEPGRGIIR
jgi:UDP-N-acetylglucosamine acyltransferase